MGQRSMLIFLTDENIEAEIPVQLRRHLPSIDVVDVRDVGLAQTSDEIILQWAADNGRVIITRDVNTMRGLAEDRIRAGLPMPGVIIVLENVSYGAAIQGIIRYAVGQLSEIENRVVFIRELRRTLL